MDVGTAKPSASSAEGVALSGRLIDRPGPSAARFRADALKLIGRSRRADAFPCSPRHHALLQSLTRGSVGSWLIADEGLRAQIDVEAAARGWPALHAELSK